MEMNSRENPRANDNMAENPRIMRTTTSKPVNVHPPISIETPLPYGGHVKHACPESKLVQLYSAKASTRVTSWGKVLIVRIGS